MPLAQLEQLRVVPGEPARLAERDPRDRLGLEKDEAEKQTKKLRERIDELQFLLFGAPWHVVPADRNWVKAYTTASIVCEILERLDPKLPERPEGR